MDKRGDLDFSSCKVISTSSGREFFLLVAWSGSTFDVYLTDVHQSWKALGISAPQDHAFTPKDWLSHAREALYDPDPQRQFQYDVEPDGSSMQLEWTAEYDGGATYLCACTLEPATDTPAMLASMLSHLCLSYKVLKRAVAQMDRQSEELKRQLESTQTQWESHMEVSKDRETDLFVKFSLVLNSKKSTIQELTDRLADKEAEVAQLREQLVQEGGASSADDADSNPDLDDAEGEEDEGMTTGTAGQDRALQDGHGPTQARFTGTALSTQGPRGLTQQPPTRSTQAPAPPPSSSGHVLPAATEPTPSAALVDDLNDLGY